MFLYTLIAMINYLVNIIVVVVIVVNAADCIGQRT